MLWGAQGALQSGALEALVYEELDRAGAASRYAAAHRPRDGGRRRSRRRSRSASPRRSFALGGFTALGAASVAGLRRRGARSRATLPEHRAARASRRRRARARRVRRRSSAPASPRSAAAPALRAGAAARAPRSRAIWGCARRVRAAARRGRRRGGRRRSPLLFLLVYVGVTAGGLLAGRAAGCRPRRCSPRCSPPRRRRSRAGALSGVPAGFALDRAGVRRLPGG